MYTLPKCCWVFQITALQSLTAAGYKSAAPPTCLCRPTSVLHPLIASACACSPYSDFNALWHFVSMVIFGVDMVISFRVAYIENDILVTEVLDIAKRYLK